MLTKSLDTFIRELAANLDDESGQITYMKLLRISIPVLEELNLHIFHDFKSVLKQADENMTVHIGDCSKPVQVFKYVRVGDNDCVYPLGRNEVFVRPKDYPCDPVEVPLNFKYDVNINSDALTIPYVWFYGWYHGELYDYAETRFFGKWDYVGDGVIFIEPGGCVVPGDSVIIRYKPVNVDYCIPLEAQGMLRHRILQLYWENQAPYKGNYHFMMFKRELRMYKRHKLSGYSYDDYLDAMTSAYSNRPR